LLFLLLSAFSIAIAFCYCYCYCSLLLLLLSAIATPAVALVIEKKAAGRDLITAVSAQKHLASVTATSIAEEHSSSLLLPTPQLQLILLAQPAAGSPPQGYVPVAGGLGDSFSGCSGFSGCGSSSGRGVSATLSTKGTSGAANVLQGSGVGRFPGLVDSAAPSTATGASAVAGAGAFGAHAGFIGAYSPEQRRLRIERFIEKRTRRVWTKKVKYDVRKNFADSRLRVKGRFVKKEDEDIMREILSI
jgi:hypothetical protein